MDVAILLQIIAGYDQLDPFCGNQPQENYLGLLRDGVRGWRIAWAQGGFFDEYTDPEVMEAVSSAVKVFENLGANITPIDIPEISQATQANGLMAQSDAAALYQEQLSNSPQDFGADVLKRLQNGRSYTSIDYSLARRTQNLLRNQYQRLLKSYHILLTPTTPISAPTIQGSDAITQARLLTRFTAPFNLTGLPAISLPCGFTKQGLPIGLQLISRAWAEADLLRAAYSYEQATTWHMRKPALETA
jgi:aspartyl-tRNA(Asn)/glutamyl-tRNA(Gln) amidotransferase subunit A